MAPIATVLAFLLLSGTCSAATSCSQTGFTGSQRCTDCDKLKEYTGDEGLWVECRECCTATSDGTQLYEKATLKVCKHRLRDYPHAETFIGKEAARFPQLRVVYEWGSAPTLVLKAGTRVEKLRIDNWKTENIVEFLRDRLKPSS